MVPRLIVAFGARRKRFEAASEVQNLSGISPVTEASGKTKLVHMRWACPKFLRQTFHEFAAHSLAQSAWAKAYYDLQRHNHKDHHAAVRSLAYKWIRIIYRCWKNRQPYENDSTLRSLQHRNSPVIGAFVPTTAGEWKLVSGFQKFSRNNS